MQQLIEAGGRRAEGIPPGQAMLATIQQITAKDELVRTLKSLAKDPNLGVSQTAKYQLEKTTQSKEKAGE